MFFIVAWLGDYDERESVSPVIDHENGEVRLFPSVQEAIEWAREEIVPDFDYVVVPFERVEDTAVFRAIQSFVGLI